ncbi:DUF4296 domain-containing protein [Spirosoma taeanense]|uniref:DUF4296 domain-containing protein n=1 Tax=Spirosoma taeanense TaxID=2735870 RepID=A0A6M5Y3C4_9BACT|nr:DUF4296 domain-containing protein [Spirosoma taeanense]QJW88235.1 DUF4296 domain-containing protein [Spirosoma taeanense]
MRRYRMKRTIWSCLWLSVLWVAAACQAAEDTRPDNLIPESRMVDILTEVHMTEARVSRLSLSSIDSSSAAYKHLEAQLFRKMQVDTAAYSKSYTYYSSHPKQMEAIYKQVIEKLKKKMEAKKPVRS